METAEIVKIAVSAAPYSIDKPYDYLVPPELLETAVPGVRVTVPFGRGNRTSEGIILARTPGEKMQGLKPLLSVLDRGPVLDGDGIALALWLRQRYFCTLFEAVKAILPALGNEFITLFKDTSLVSAIGAAELTYHAQRIGGRTFDYMPPLIGAAVMYLVIVIVFTWLQGKLERRLRQSDRR